jgi:hypothetical protein
MYESNFTKELRSFATTKYCIHQECIEKLKLIRLIQEKEKEHTLLLQNVEEGLMTPSSSIKIKEGFK